MHRCLCTVVVAVAALGGSPASAGGSGSDGVVIPGLPDAATVGLPGDEAEDADSARRRAQFGFDLGAIIGAGGGPSLAASTDLTAPEIVVGGIFVLDKERTVDKSLNLSATNTPEQGIFVNFANVRGFARTRTCPAAAWRLALLHSLTARAGCAGDGEAPVQRHRRGRGRVHEHDRRAAPLGRDHLPEGRRRVRGSRPPPAAFVPPPAHAPARAKKNLRGGCEKKPLRTRPDIELCPDEFNFYGECSRRRDCHLMAPPCTFISCFNRDKQGVSVQ